MVALIKDPVSQKRERGFVFSITIFLREIELEI